MRNRALVTAVLVAVTLALPVRSQAAYRKAVFPVDTNAKIGIFGPDWQGPVRSEAAWDAAARNFDVLIGQREQYGSRLDRMHSVNPKLSILLYNNGPYLKKGSSQYENTMRDHPEYFARDSGGNLINVKLFPDNYLMDQGNAGYRAQAADAIADVLQNYPGFDGVSVDSMGSGAINTSYVSGVPVNKATGNPYAAAEWLATSVQTLDAIKAAAQARLATPRYVLYNGLINGPTFAASSKVLANSKADGGMAESFLRLAASSPTKYPTAANWLKELKMLTTMQSRGKSVFAWTKIWTSSTTQQQADWNRFALATYLLGKNKKAFFNYLPTTSSERTAVDPSWRTNLGAPLGSYTVSNGVYSRNFANGKVTVNPTTHAASITTT